jgi:CheY-like chemotaxis protein
MLSLARPRPEPLRSDLRARDERLASLGLLAGQLAHDFNNLLAPILGYSTLIKEEFPPDSTGQQFAGSLETAARRAEKILEQTLLATRPQRRFSPQEQAFDQLITSEAAKWQAELPSTAGVNLSVHTESCKLVADDYHWRVAIRHLLNNARYGCAIGGNISVRLETVHLSAVECADLGLPESPAIRLSVSDDGFGMPPEVITRAFEPFYTNRPKGAAQGLGLTACHSIAYLHGGQIELISAPDEGTQVTIWLPLEFLAPKQTTAPSDPVIRSRESSDRHKRVLMVDDDPLVREVLKAALIRAGYEVLTADDGQSAWKMFSRFHRELSAVLSDFRMPVMDGVQLLKQMRELNPGVPVLLLSGDVSGLLEERLKEHNLWVDIIPKPCPLNKLIEQISKLPA